MDYFITLNEKSIDAIGEAVEKPITVIEGLKEDIADLEQTVAEKDETIAEKDEEIAALEAQIAEGINTYERVIIRVRNNNTGSTLAIPCFTGENLYGSRNVGSNETLTWGISQYNPNAPTLTHYIHIRNMENYRLTIVSQDADLVSYEKKSDAYGGQTFKWISKPMHDWCVEHVGAAYSVVVDIENA